MLPFHVAVLALTLITCLAAVHFRVYEPLEAHTAIVVSTSLAVIALIAYARYVLGWPWISASIFYLILLWIFHYGLSFTAVVAPGALDSLPDWALEWLFWPNARLAMILGVIGAAGFVFAAGLVRNRRGAGRPSATSDEYDHGLYLGGWITMLAAIAVSVAAVVSGGLELLSTDYGTFGALAESTFLGTALSFSHVGCLMAVCGARGRQWIAPFFVWASLIGVPTLLMGSRAGAMVSLLGFLVVLTQRGIRFNRGLLVGSALSALIVVPAVEGFRSVGFANRSNVNWTDFTLLDTFVELGGSLQTTKAYIDWIEDGDLYQRGSTFWAPFDRQVLARIVPGREQIPYEVDTRIPQRFMITREGPIGGSATGEAYYNFGSVGPFLFYSLIGLIFASLEAFRIRAPLVCATLGIIVFVFYFHIRGHWYIVPASIAENLAIVAFWHVLGRYLPGAPTADLFRPSHGAPAARAPRRPTAGFSGAGSLPSS